MKSLISIGNILAFITYSDGHSLRTSSENRVLSIPASDSMTTGFKEDCRSGHQTHGLSPGIEFKLQANDTSSRSLLSVGNHEDSKSLRVMGLMKPASCSKLPGTIPSNFQTEVVNCKEINPSVRADCNSKHTRSFSKSQSRKLMDEGKCSIGSLLRCGRHYEESSGLTAGYEHTYPILKKNSASNVIDFMTPLTPEVEAPLAQNPTKNQFMQPPRVQTPMKRDTYN